MSLLKLLQATPPLCSPEVANSCHGNLETKLYGGTMCNVIIVCFVNIFYEGQQSYVD